MSSSHFEVREPEIESDKDLEFGLDTCEENGITLSTQIDGELPRDHTYTKEPDVEQEDEEKDGDSDVNVEGMEDSAASPVKGKGGRKSQKAVKKPAAKPKPKTPTKKSASPARKRGRKSTGNEVNTDTPDENLNNGVTEDKDATAPSVSKDKPAPAKRGRKRKVEEKDSVIDQSIVDEVQNIAEESGSNNVEEAEASPKKKAKTPAKKSPAKVKKAAPKKSIKNSGDDGETQKLKNGWVRKTVVRQSGKTAGCVDVYIYSPDGQKFRSRPELIAHFAKSKSSLKIDDFDFSKKGPQTATSSATPKKSTKKSTPPAPKASAKKKPAPTPKKGATTKLLVKIVSAKAKIPKGGKSPTKGGKAKGNKKKKA